MAASGMLAGSGEVHSLQTPAKGFFFSRTPMLLLDQDARVLDINAALQELMRTDLAGCKSYDFHYLSERLRPRLEGELFPFQGVARTCLSPSAAGKARLGFNDLHIAQVVCRYHSPGFGAARLRSVEIPCLEITTGELKGSIVNVEILELEEESTYWDGVRKRWAHEVMWEIYAASYDRILPEMPFYREVVDRHLAAIRAAGAARVLDIGAGTGNVAVPLLKDGRPVAAVNISRAMLAKLSSKLDGASEKNLTVIEDTAECLPHLNDGSFDGVTALLAFFDMRDPRAALLEAVRVLRPGGTLVVTDPKAGFNVKQLMTFGENHLRESGLYEDLRDDWARIQSVAPALEACIQSNTSAGEEESSRPRWSAETIHEILRGLGFAELTLEDSHLGNCATIAGKKPG